MELKKKYEPANKVHYPKYYIAYIKNNYENFKDNRHNFCIHLNNKFKDLVINIYVLKRIIRENCLIKNRKQGEYLNCEYCGKKFYCFKSELKRNRKYCSKKCLIEGGIGKWNKGLKRTKKDIERITKLKKGKTYEEMYGEEKAKRIKRESSKRMIGNNFNALKIKKIRIRPTEDERKQREIGRRRKISLSKKGKHLSEEHKKKVSNTLKKFYENKENHPRWIGGKSFELYGVEFNNKLKETIRQRDNYQCKLCGISQILLKTKLSIHHIDYDKKNNLEGNLISLCCKCHPMTNTNRNKWKEYFNRRKNLK